MKLLQAIKKMIFLPTVMDLGWSKMNALPMRGLGAREGDRTWEDYHELMKMQYPVRYFLFDTLPRLFRWHVAHPLGNAKRFIKHFIWKRTHLLDLRQRSWVPGCDEYDWGYIDPRETMLYSCMTCLGRFIEETDAKNHLEWLKLELMKTTEDMGRGIIEDSIALYTEALAIHRWWTSDRKAKFLAMQLSDKYQTTEERQETFSKWDAFEAEEDEMLVRLMRIRRGLWN